MAKLHIKNRFGTTPNNVLNSKELSFKAKGLYGFIQSKPEGWNFSVEKIAYQSKDGIDAIRGGLKELENIGFLERNKYQNELGHWEIDYILYQEIPTLENPVTGKPVNISKKDIVKKNIVIKKEDATEVAEIHPFFGFPIDEYENDSFVDETGAYIPQLKDEYGRIFTKTQLNKMKKEYEQSLKQQVSVAKRKETMNDTAKEMVQILKDFNGVSYLDGRDSYKHANSLKKKFTEHLIKDKNNPPNTIDDILTKQFRLLLGHIRRESPFHSQHLTNMAYLDKWFIKIIRDINKK